MNMQVDFVKGHCGWDTLTLLPEGSIPPQQELEAALKILAAPVYGGLEVGYLGRGDAPNRIRLRMVDSTSRNWIAMCGGMTQVIGKALVETFFRDHFEVDTSASRLSFELLTESGAIPIHVEVSDRRAIRTTTVMDGFVSHLQRAGIEPLTLESCEVLRVGDMLVLDLAQLERVHPHVDFTRRDAGTHLDIVNGILKAYRQLRGGEGVTGMMFDRRPEGPGQFRIYPRFYSDDLAAASIPFEFQCGTGTVAVGLALAHHGLLSFAAGVERVIFEWGSQRTTPDPYGIRTSELHLSLHEGRVKRASFTHSVVEILAEGTLSLPTY